MSTRPWVTRGTITSPIPTPARLSSCFSTPRWQALTWLQQEREREGLIEKPEWEREEECSHSHGRTRYQIFKAQHSKQCRKLHAERLTNSHQRDFLKMFVLYVNFWGDYTWHAVSVDPSARRQSGHMTHLMSSCELCCSHYCERWNPSSPSVLRSAIKIVQIIDFRRLPQVISTGTTTVRKTWRPTQPCGLPSHICPLLWPWCIDPLFSHFGSTQLQFVFNGSFLFLLFESCN